MLSLNNRIKAFVSLGNRINELLNGEANLESLNDFNTVIDISCAKNKWFTKDSVKQSFEALTNWLTEDALVDWTNKYGDSLNQTEEETVAVIMAGNIPMVGFHDYLSVLISGKKLVAKLSSEDPLLLKFVHTHLCEFESEFKGMVEFTEGKMAGFDKVIATGSNNTSKYFEQYFGKYPNIIRKNRNSLAVLTGEESEEELKALGKDIFSYYGLGCRNVSKLMIPKGFDFDPFFKAMMNFDKVGENSKYVNNIDYNKAILLINREQFLDGGTLLLKEENSLYSSVGILNYEFYDSKNSIDSYIGSEKESIQCVVGKDYIPFGEAQKPSLMDYPDGVDIIEFLIN